MKNKRHRKRFCETQVGKYILFFFYLILQEKFLKFLLYFIKFLFFINYFFVYYFYVNQISPMKIQMPKKVDFFKKNISLCRLSQLYTSNAGSHIKISCFQLISSGPRQTTPARPDFLMGRVNLAQAQPHANSGCALGVGLSARPIQRT